jgi:hypothetical protein
MTQPALCGAHLLEARAMRPSVALGRSRASPAVFVLRKSRGTGDSLDWGCDSAEATPAAATEQDASAARPVMLFWAAVEWSSALLLCFAVSRNDAVVGRGDWSFLSAELWDCMEMSTMSSPINHRCFERRERL